MTIAILSDSHDNMGNLEKAISQIRGKAESVIFCGDFCAPFMSRLLASLEVPIYACLGNNDEDQIGLHTQGGNHFRWFPLYKEFGEVELENRKVAFCHYPRLGELLARTGEYDAVFHGHTHIARNETMGKTIFVNPGSICGIQGGKPAQASYALYHTESNTAEVINI